MGFYADKWFEFIKDEVKTFEIGKETDDQYKNIYDNFLVEYATRENSNLVLPEKITTKCIAISTLQRINPLPYAGGIWEIIK